MPKKLSPEARSLKRALKTFKNCYFLMLDTEIMNDLTARREFQSALLTIKSNYHEKKGV
jgi:hypothetical protein